MSLRFGDDKLIITVYPLGTANFTVLVKGGRCTDFFSQSIKHRFTSPSVQIESGDCLKVEIGPNYRERRAVYANIGHL